MEKGGAPAVQRTRRPQNPEHCRRSRDHGDCRERPASGDRRGARIDTALTISIDGLKRRALAGSRGARGPDVARDRMSRRSGRPLARGVRWLVSQFGPLSAARGKPSIAGDEDHSIVSRLAWTASLRGKLNSSTPSLYLALARLSSSSGRAGSSAIPCRNGVRCAGSARLP